MTTPDRATRVLVVSSSSVAGGAERALANLIGRLPEVGFDPHVALFEAGPLEAWVADAGAPCEVVPFGRLRHPWEVARTVRALRRVARRTGAELVLDSLHTAHIYGGLAAATLGLPAVWWQHTIPSRRYGGPLMTRPLLDRLASRLPAEVVVVTSAEAAAAQRQLSPRRRVEVVHPGTDLARVRARAGQGTRLRAEQGWGAEPVVGIVGWVRPWKGQDVFLRAAAQLADRWPHARFVVVGGTGDESFRGMLDDLVDELGLAGRVAFTGHRTDVHDWFDAMDVAVHASYGEPFGLVLVEAMALGTPVVATSAGGPAEIIVDGESGLLVAPGDHAAMAAAIARLLDDRALRSRIGAAGRARSDRFGDQRMAAEMAALLHDVMRPRPSRDDNQ
ncbi:MAG: glycosyltransferase family 4 protein [Acidimicrobiales bacterium]